MNKHFMRELTKLSNLLLSMGSLVEDRLKITLQALQDLDGAKAKEITKSDDLVDSMEISVEEEALKIMALYQPVAADLRFLVTTTRINNDLERIGDEVVNVARRVEHLTSHPAPDFYFDYSEMGHKACQMLNQSIKALIDQDVELAIKIVDMDNEVDALQRTAYDEIKLALAKHSNYTGYLINLFLISRHLERIGDLATNICEDVIYMKRGNIVRHKKKGMLEL